VEGLVEGLGGPLRLLLIALKTLVGFAAAALCRFDLSFLSN
jgi:hypothetical protein